MRKRNIIVFLFSLLNCILSSVYADVAPPTYPGYTLWPFSADNIRMTSEKVNIYYGDICKVEAVFEIINTSKQSVVRKIGFPFQIAASNQRDIVIWTPERGLKGDSTKKIYDFKLNLNSVNLQQTDRSGSMTAGYAKQNWTGWTGTFKPGVNKATLSYNIKTSYAGSGSWERTLFYSHHYFRSDKKWPDKIDSVEITIIFPDKIHKEQILSTTTPGDYELRDKAISWHFSSFETGNESTIALHLIDFKLFAEMQKYEKVLTVPDTSNTAKLEAASFFASLAPPKGIRFDIPYRFEFTYYQQVILPNLSKKELTLFDSLYVLTNDSIRGDYFRIRPGIQHYQNEDLRQRIVVILDRIGYYKQIEYPVIYAYIVGARRLFREVTVSDPKNASVWIRYFEKFYLLEHDACSPCILYAGGPYNSSELQKLLVQEAYKYCSSDSIIGAWYAYFFRTKLPLPDELDLHGATDGNTVTIDIPHWGGGWVCKDVSSDDFSVLKKVYTHTGNKLLLKSNAREDDRKKVVNMLDSSFLYHEQFCQTLSRLKKSESKKVITK